MLPIGQSNAFSHAALRESRVFTFVISSIMWLLFTYYLHVYNNVHF